MGAPLSTREEMVVTPCAAEGGGAGGVVPGDWIMPIRTGDRDRWCQGRLRRSSHAGQTPTNDARSLLALAGGGAVVAGRRFCSDVHLHTQLSLMPDASSVRHVRWSDLPEERVTDLISRRLITGTAMMIAHVYLKKDALVPQHSHHNEQITYILSGALHFWIGADRAREVIVREGEVLHIPSHVPHEARALEDTLDVDVFSPPRQDWLDGTDSYFHKK